METKSIIRDLRRLPPTENPALLHTPLLVHEDNALLIVCREKGKELTLLDAANPGQYVMVIALKRWKNRPGKNWHGVNNGCERTAASPGLFELHAAMGHAGTLIHVCHTIIASRDAQAGR